MAKGATDVGIQVRLGKEEWSLSGFPGSRKRKPDPKVNQVRTTLNKKRNESPDSTESAIVANVDSVSKNPKETSAECIKIERLPQFYLKPVYQKKDIMNGLSIFLSRAAEHMATVRQETDASFGQFLDSMKEQKADADDIATFVRVIQGSLRISRSCFDSLIKRLEEAFEMDIGTMNDARRSCGRERTQFLMKAGRFSVVGVIQSFELEFNGLDNFAAAIGTEPESQNARKQLWEEILSKKRYAPIASALAVVFGYEQFKIPAVIAEALVNYSKEEKSKLANIWKRDEIHKSYLGVVFINEHLVTRPTALVLHTICRWLGVSSEVGTFEDVKTFLPICNRYYADDVIEDCIFAPLEKDHTDTGIWFEDLIVETEDAAKLLLWLDAGRVAVVREKFARFQQAAQREFRRTLDVHWPLYRACQVIETWAWESDTAMSKLKDLNRKC